MRHTVYVPLHLHSQYSLLDGAVRINDLVEQASNYKMPAIAITDHGNLFGAIDFYKRIKKAEIKPIIGFETYIASHSRHDRGENKTQRNFHLILLCKNMEGYRNLISMVSKSFTEGFYYKPRIDKELLSKHSSGLIALSACMKGEVPYYLHNNRKDLAVEAAKQYREFFGPKNFYLEIQANELPEQDELNKQLIALGKEMDIPLVATNDTHYLKREDAKAHDILLCIQTGKTINNPDRLKFKGSGLYFKSPAEMEQNFKEVPEAITNTMEIADRCELDFTFGQFRLPRFPLSDGYDFKGYLRKVAEEGLRKKLGDNISDVYRERFRKELEIIEQMGFSAYFLIVWDFIRYSRSKGIPVGPGRGSAAGSLVAYVLDITNVDPIRYNLLFERFLNPERISMPDIDVDFCKERRGEVIDYVTELYGRDHVAQIITFGTMQARAVLRDVGRAMDIPYAVVDKVAKLVPPVLGINLTDALKQEPKLKEIYDTESNIRELIDVALRLEGLTRHASTHAAGIVISPEPLNNFLPLYKVPNDDCITTQFSMESIESLGLLKFDFLGLKTLTVINKAEKFINENKQTLEDGKTFYVRNIDLEDRDTYKLLSSGRTNSVFQLESSGMKELLIRAKPETFEDVVALLALYRPGPLGEGMDVEFVNRKHGKTAIQYDHPMLEPILKDTYGVILYQEQVMQIANKMANFTMGQADILRKAMGKKKAEVMEKLKNNFIEGAKNNKIPPKKSERIFDIMASFAKYGFNKSHSAAYALITYQTAYLKTHYPVEFMAATLSSEMDNTDKIVKYINECREMGIEILPPCINKSGREFQIDGKSIRFGLEAIKGVGAAALESIIEIRANGEFNELANLCERVDTRKVNKKVIDSLIKAGAMSSMGKRSQLSSVLDDTMDIAAKTNKDKSSFQVSLFQFEEAPSLKLPDIDEWDRDTILKIEKEALGFYISGHPLEKYKRQFKSLSISSIPDLQEKPDGTIVIFGGLMQSCRKMNTKKGEPMAYLTLEDLYGTINVVCFPDVYKKSQEDLTSESPLVLSGKLENSEKGIKILASKVLLLDKAVENPSVLYQPETPRWGNGTYGKKNGSNGRAYIQKISRVELFIDEKKVKPDVVSKLKELIIKHQGDCLVCVRVRCLEPAPHETMISTTFHTQATEQFREEAEEILGRGAVSYI